jgi:hypothetical protein
MSFFLNLFEPLSEEKAVRSLRIDRVTEKNQKQWKILIEKIGRFNWRLGLDAEREQHHCAFIRLPTGMRSFLSSATCGIQASTGARRWMKEP